MAKYQTIVDFSSFVRTFIRSFCIRTITFCLILAVVLASCTSSQEPPEQTNRPEPSAPTLQPSATPRPKVHCPTEEVDHFISEFEITMEEWDDTILLAESTSRMSLAPVIKELQDIKRSTRRMERPECAGYLVDFIIVAMEADIDAFISFLAQESDRTVSNQIIAADKAWALVKNEIESFRNDPYKAYLESDITPAEFETSLITPEPFVLPDDWMEYKVPNGELFVSFPRTWKQEVSEYLKFKSQESDGEITVVVNFIDDKTLLEMESDAGRMFFMKSVLQGIDYDYYNERSANHSNYALNKGFVIRASIRDTESDGIDDTLWAYVITPDEKIALVHARTDKDEFTELSLLIFDEILSSIR